MKFVIVGGGITGWLSALIFSHRQPNHKYVIVESSEIDTIGVGEGTTGLFSDVIDEIPDINFAEFLRKTKATPKIGIVISISSIHLFKNFSTIMLNFSK